MVLTCLFVGIALQVFPGKQRPTMKIPYHTSKTLPFRPPHLADAKSKRIANAMLRAESHLAPCRIRINGEGGKVVIDWDEGKLRQDDANGSWSYSNGVLTVSCKSGFYRGTANRADVLDYLAALTGGADTFARQLLSHQRPFSDFFTPDETARVIGNEKLNGQPTYILSISGRAIRGSLNIRKADNLVVSAYASSLSPSGAEVYRAQRTYSYGGLPGKAVFRMTPPRRGRIKHLPKSAINLGKRLIK